MKRTASTSTVAAAALVSIWLAAEVSAQEVLPRPLEPFEGHIGRTAKDSQPDFPEEVHAPEGAPNVLLIMTDDVGFGASSTFGGPVPTPTTETCSVCSTKKKSPRKANPASSTGGP